MASNNNDNSGAGLVIGLAAAAVYVVAILFAFAILVLTIVLTVLAFMAWNRPLRVGRMVITPAEARQFVYRGWIGMWSVPIILALGDLFLGWPIDWHYQLYYMLAGYCAGSIGIEMLLGDAERDGPLVEYLPPQHQSQDAQVSQNALPAPPREPFRYASWDDE